MDQFSFAGRAQSLRKVSKHFCLAAFLDELVFSLQHNLQELRIRRIVNDERTVENPV